MTLFPVTMTFHKDNNLFILPVSKHHIKNQFLVLAVHLHTIAHYYKQQKCGWRGTFLCVNMTKRWNFLSPLLENGSKCKYPLNTAVSQIEQIHFTHSKMSSLLIEETPTYKTFHELISNLAI